MAKANNLIGDIDCSSATQPGEHVVCDYVIISHKYANLSDKLHEQIPTNADAQLAQIHEQISPCSDLHCVENVINKGLATLGAVPPPAPPQATDTVPIAGEGRKAVPIEAPPAATDRQPAIDMVGVPDASSVSTAVPGTNSAISPTPEPKKPTSLKEGIGGVCVLLGIGFFVLGLNVTRDRRFKSGFRGGSFGAVKFGILSFIVGVIIIVVPLLYLIGLAALPFVLKGLVKAYENYDGTSGKANQQTMHEDDIATHSSKSKAEVEARQQIPKQKTKRQPLRTDEKPNHYEVLGIRPTASKEEIELAYRGRRTQYHPDKYANADEETMKWATSNMQAVNEAYTALSDQHRRNEYDTRQDHSNSKDNDDLYSKAVSIILENNRASISLIQRKLKLEYNHAARLLEKMEQDGIVGPMSNNGNREILRRG